MKHLGKSRILREHTIVRNSVHCLDCDTEIESTPAQPYKACPCGNVFVNGGHEYIGRGFRRGAHYKDTSIETFE